MDVKDFVFSLLVAGGGGAAVAFGLFRYLGDKWIEARFAQRLETFRHEQAKELQRLKVQIDALLHGKLKLQERELAVLPAAWELLAEAHIQAGSLLSPIQTRVGVEGMTRNQLDAFVNGSELVPIDREAVLDADLKSRQSVYDEAITRYRLADAMQAVSAFREFVTKNSLFFTPELRDLLMQIGLKLQACLTTFRTGLQVKSFAIRGEAWDAFKSDVEALHTRVEGDIRKRFADLGRLAEANS